MLGTIIFVNALPTPPLAIGAEREAQAVIAACLQGGQGFVQGGELHLILGRVRFTPGQAIDVVRDLARFATGLGMR
jgi:hypothetical protein